MRKRAVACSILGILNLFTFFVADAEQTVPDELAGIDIEAKLGQPVPLDLSFTDQNGKSVTLAQYFMTGRPVIVTLNYYGCQTLCNLVLDGVATGLNDKALGFTPGQEFAMVTVSIDPADTPQIAKTKREMYLHTLWKPVPNDAWPFLVGNQSSIRTLANALGFHYRYDEASKQFAHAAGIFVLTPQGRISQVLYGIEFPGKELRLALTEASLGSIGSPLDKILLWCYHYDAKERRYTPWAMGIMRVGAVLTLIALGVFLALLWRGERRKVVYE